MNAANDFQPTVVVADDEPAWRLLVRLLLEPRGFSLVEVEDGAAALHAVRLYRPRLLLLDMVMPRMDGAEVCRQLRANLPPPLPAIIVMSANVPCDGRPFSADIFLRKPFAPGALLGAVDTLLASPAPLAG